MAPILNLKDLLFIPGDLKFVLKFKEQGSFHFVNGTESLWNELTKFLKALILALVREPHYGTLPVMRTYSS